MHLFGDCKDVTINNVTNYAITWSTCHTVAPNLSCQSVAIKVHLHNNVLCSYLLPIIVLIIVLCFTGCSETQLVLTIHKKGESYREQGKGSPKLTEVAFVCKVL